MFEHEIQFSSELRADETFWVLGRYAERRLIRTCIIKMKSSDL